MYVEGAQGRLPRSAKGLGEAWMHLVQDAGARVVETRCNPRARKGTVKINSWVCKLKETVAAS